MTEGQSRLLKAKRVELRKQLLAHPKFQAARVVFASAAGKALLDHLGAMVDADDLLGGSVEETYFNLGRRDLFRELRFLATAGERTGDDAP